MRTARCTLVLVILAVMTTSAYRLIDFGNERKLEQIGNRTLDRPCPAAADFRPTAPHAWHTADARFVKPKSQPPRWCCARHLASFWQTKFSTFTLRLKMTPFGHVGVFPEQQPNWEWISQRLQQVITPLTILNLFAYTGGSTFSAAIAGANVVHVDAAKNVIQWARSNAKLSGLDQSPIRWIAEDARKFVHREIRRGNRYDGVILDPPSYGHGPKGESWKMEENFFELLADCRTLIGHNPQLVLVSCHSPGYDEQRLRETVSKAIPEIADFQLVGRPMWLVSDDARQLPAGYTVRWPEVLRP